MRCTRLDAGHPPELLDDVGRVMAGMFRYKGRPYSELDEVERDDYLRLAHLYQQVRLSWMWN